MIKKYTPIFRAIQRPPRVPATPPPSPKMKKICLKSDFISFKTNGQTVRSDRQTDRQDGWMVICTDPPFPKNEVNLLKNDFISFKTNGQYTEPRPA